MVKAAATNRRRKYRYKSRTDAEDALKREETKSLRLFWLVSEIMDQTVVWTKRRSHYRIGVFHFWGFSGPLFVVMSDRKQDHNVRDVTVYDQDELQQLKADLSRHYSMVGHTAAADGLLVSIPEALAIAKERED